MTVSSTNRKAGPYYGNGVTAAFPFSFKVFAASDLLVVKTNLTTGVDTVLAATDYSVSLTADTTGGYSGGTVTLTAGALASTYTLTITSSILYTQNTDLTNNGGFYPKVINSALDRLTILCQQLLEQVSRSLKLSISTPANVKPTLPAPVKNNMIAWNENADGLQNLNPQALATIVAFGTANSDKFSGDGSTTQFALSNNPGALNNLDVSIGGVTQRPGIDYTWSAGTVITFTTAPATGTNNILVRYMQGLPQGYTTGDLVQVNDGAGGSLFTTVAGFISRLMSSSGAALVRWKYSSSDAVARTVEDGLRERVSVTGFGALGDGTNQYNAIQKAFLWCVANKKDLYLPSGAYSCGANNFPFKNPDYPATSLYDCNGITIYGDGETTILTTESPAGADVLNLYNVKNLHIRNLAVTATLKGTSGSGSNGISVVGGFDNVTVDGVWINNLPYVDKGTYLDGGKALTIQTGTPTTECGTLKARNVFANGCVHGFGIEIDLPNWATKRHSVDVEITARDCHIGAVVSAGESSAPLSAGMTSGIDIRLTAINCQRVAAIGRAHGIGLQAQIVTTKTAAQRRLNPSGGTWNPSDTVVDGLFAAYAKNSRFSIVGDLGECSYKVQIGGATAGSSGQGAYSENNIYYFDVAGSSTIADVNVIDSSGATVKTSEIYVSASTATTLPASLYTPANANMVAIGPAYRFDSPKISGSLSFTEVDGKSSYIQMGKDGYGVFVQQLASSSVDNLNFKVKTHSGTPAFSIRNDGGIATLGRITASSVATVKGVLPVYTQDNALYGYVPVYTTYTP
ncbi:unnamed protein product [Brugia timori]|uniref:Pectate_lyase_3 domain-containing protein n=1 Tax=Brugia timori TaxID=42155 RepID=A0A0R3Q2Z0_9BILA|nr:unnamed protein product [Brugia timori]